MSEVTVPKINIDEIIKKNKDEAYNNLVNELKLYPDSIAQKRRHLDRIKAAIIMATEEIGTFNDYISMLEKFGCRSLRSEFSYQDSDAYSEIKRRMETIICQKKINEIEAALEGLNIQLKAGEEQCVVMEEELGKIKEKKAQLEKDREVTV